MAEPIISKTCTKCKIEKLLAEFYRDRTKPDGHHPRCKPCFNEGITERANTVKPRPLKQCPTCKEYKPISEFYKDHHKPDGLRYDCKRCADKTTRKYQQSLKGKAALERYLSKRGKITRQGYWASRQGKIVHQRYKKSDKGKVTERRYRQSQNFKERRAEYRRNNRDKTKARRAIRYQIYKGYMSPASTQPCLYCEEQAKYWHHYLGYAPEHILDVIPLCRACDKKDHSKSA